MKKELLASTAVIELPTFEWFSEIDDILLTEAYFAKNLSDKFYKGMKRSSSASIIDKRGMGFGC